MNRSQHFLWILAEECAEVAQRASKASRFSLDEIQEGQTLNNAERIMVEYADLVATMEKLLEEGVVTYPNNFQEMIERKKDRIEKFLLLSAKQGTLDATG